MTGTTRGLLLCHEGIHTKTTILQVGHSQLACHSICAEGHLVCIKSSHSAAHHVAQNQRFQYKHGDPQLYADQAELHLTCERDLDGGIYMTYTQTEDTAGHVHHIV